MLDRVCPCGLPALYAACCGRFHAGEPAPTAELLMRSRFSAFTLGDAAYLRLTWDPATRPRRLDLADDVRWTRLDVLGHTGGGLLDTEGTVEFRAHHEGGVMRENSRFRREGRRWLYVGPS
ncbi:YchJ family protein [Pseudonocardia sp. TRM90224]|uniref:YchJ family protein n=1 Tax=Pseudonocardia sp. TRM90224 TaxID=2812678 RepID=UPI001E3F8341|nr:YchJ family metal-binding protein [Pseudonocardia sp. TRM90224]